MRAQLYPRILAPVLIVIAGCSEDGSERETAATSGLTLTSSASSSSSGDTSAPTTSGASAATTGTTGVSGATEGASSGELSSTGAISVSTTDPGTSTGVGTSGEMSTGTTAACVCTPGEINGCEGDAQLECGDDCLGFELAPCGPGQKCLDGACVALFCQPGATVCEGENAVKQCNALGEAFDAPVNCLDSEGCVLDACVSLCAQAEATPSSVGCSFFANRMDNYDNSQPDSMIVGNTSKSKSASVQLYFTPNGSNVEAPQGAPTVLLPGKTVEFKLTNAALAKISSLRKGGSYRAQSSIPVVAYQHSPIGQQATNDASMLLPEHALKADYVIASYKDGLGGYPSYFNVIAIADGTTVKWTPPQGTLAGAGVAAVAAGQTGQVAMNRFDTLQVRVANGGDISGAFVSSDKPIWVVGAVSCVNVPTGVTYCDHIEEQMLPLDYWGKKYVGAHSPKRGNEKHYWRIYGGEDGTVVTANPPVPGTPVNVNKGQWKEIVVPNNTSTIFTSDKPFLPVQYLEGTDGGAGTGDPAMYQMVATEQFLDRYAFVTGTGYNPNYAQIIRAKGNPDVLVDGVVVTGYYTVGEYEVSDWKIAQGPHLAESDAPFGVINVGYTAVTSYAYPGGMKLAVINPQ
ncbi:MAG: IgGFc-binding protein [Nannocystis sp.]|nr:IgGFc-binding protein [Nannocystis sp.]MBA3549063.1 IgGFc-binding protein [Nannocystis sp.]